MKQWLKLLAVHKCYFSVLIPVTQIAGALYCSLEKGNAKGECINGMEKGNAQRECKKGTKKGTKEGTK